MKRGEYEQGR